MFYKRLLGRQESTIVFYTEDGQRIKGQELRAGNEDRDKYIDQLASAVSTGHLKQHEFEERRDKALVAVHNSDLLHLVADLPETPRNPHRTEMVTYQVGGEWRFSPWRWGSALVLSAALIVLPGPLFAAAFHGFDNVGDKGIAPILMIMAGVVLLLGFGIGWAPDSKRAEVVREDR